MADNIASSITEMHNPATPYTEWRQLGVHFYIKILIIGALFYSLFHSEITRIVSQWSDPSWSHGILIPFFSLYFINQAKSQVINLQTRPNYLGLFLMICGILFYPLNIIHFQYGYLKPIGMIATLGAVVLFMGGWRLIRYTWLPIVFLVFAVPLPQRYYVAITMPMRQFAAGIAAVLLSLVKDLDATASGVIIDVIYKGRALDPPLNVAEACSGMRLLMAFLALGVAMAYLHYRPIWQRIILLASAIPIAIFCNVIRVTTTGFIYIFGDPKYARGIWHDGLGMLMLGLAFGLYYFLAWFMSSLFVEEVVAKPPDVVVRRSKT